MPIILAIAQNDLAVYAKNRMAIFWTFLGPAICMWFFGFLTPPGSGLAPVTVIRHGAGANAAALISELRRNGHFVSEADQPPPSGLSIELGAPGSPSQVLLHAGANETAEERTLRYEIAAALLPGAEAIGVESATPISLTLPASHPGTAGFQRSVPAYLIMFLTLNLLMSGAGFAEERLSGRMRRLLTAPIPAWSVVAGRLASRLVVAWLQMLVLFSIGVFVLRIHWENHTPGPILILSLYVLAMGSVGILIGAYSNDSGQASALAMWSALVLAPLTGLWWPVELMPAPLQTLGRLLPTGWAMQSVNAMLASGAGVGEFRLTIAGLLAVAAVAIWLSARRLAAASAVV